MSVICVAGTGLMGSAIARQLHRGRFDVGVWNRSPERAHALAGGVSRIYDDCGAALGDADLIVLCLADYAAAHMVLDTEPSALAGRDVVNLITGSPTEAALLEARVTASGGRYLDGAIEGYPADIGQPATLINFSGSADVWHRHREALSCLAGSATFLGNEVGASNAADVAFAGAFFNVALGGFLEAASYALGAGINAKGIESSLDYWMTMLGSELRNCVTALQTGDHSTDQATLEVYLAAVRSWRNTMIDAGERAALMTANLHNLEIAAAAGFGGQAISAQIKTARISQTP